VNQTNLAEVVALLERAHLLVDHLTGNEVLVEDRDGADSLLDYVHVVGLAVPLLQNFHIWLEVVQLCILAQPV